MPSTLEIKNKDVIVIGSGATAVTIIPKIADNLSHVIMLQRSATYLGVQVNKDALAKFN